MYTAVRVGARTGYLDISICKWMCVRVCKYTCVLLQLHMDLCVCVCVAHLVLGQRGLGLAVRGLSLALTLVAPHRRATRRGRHTRHGADLCNLVHLCGWRAGRNHSLLKTDRQAACAGEGKHHLKHWRNCRDHCITCGGGGDRSGRERERCLGCQ